MAGLDGRRALVTGAASERGIGRAIARRFVAEGASVIVCDVQEDLGRAAAAELGERARFVRLDVTDPDHWTRAVESAREWLGGLDILVNCAGVSLDGSIEETPLPEYRLVVDIAQTGTWLGIRAAAPLLREAGGGSIINISSAAGLIGLPLTGSYTAAKWAVRGISKQAALELAVDRIRVNTILPGFIDTHMGGKGQDQRESIAANRGHAGFTVPFGRIGEPSEIAGAAYFFASDDSSYCSGSELVVDGGMLSGPLADTADWD